LLGKVLEESAIGQWGCSHELDEDDLGDAETGVRELETIAMPVFS
jgi:hypothetical protein